MAAVCLLTGPTPEPPVSGAGPASLRLPVWFEENQGQAGAAVGFLARGGRTGVHLLSDGATLALAGSRGLKLKLVGANPHPSIEGADRLPATSNYFLGNDPARWRTAVPQYGRVRYRDVYPGIDLVYHAERQEIEFDVVVAPGADASLVQLACEGAKRTEVTRSGDLLFHVSGGAVRLRRPVVYQPAAGGRRHLEGRYRLAAGGRIRFDVTPYDRTLPLVIDPAIDYSTFLGGTSHEDSAMIAFDAAGNIYVASDTSSPAFPVVSAIQPGSRGSDDLIIVKLDPAGTTVLYSTYLGGSGSDYMGGLAVDGSGNIWIAGQTTSANFPQVNPIQPQPTRSAAWITDGFLASLDAKGSTLRYSTYFGGSLSDCINGLAFDAAGNLYASGFTNSDDFPLSSPLLPRRGSGLEAFVLKLDSTGRTVLRGTYLSGSGDEAASDIALDGQGRIYVTGRTTSADFPRAGGLGNRTLQGRQDVFVTRFDSGITALEYSTYLGGSRDESSPHLAVDASGNAYVAGTTMSADFPLVNAVQERHGLDKDAFLVKVDPAGSALLFSTRLGGAYNDEGSAIALDAAGNVYLAGNAQSSDFPTVDALQTCRSRLDSPDAFVAVVNPAASRLVFSTCLGGAGGDQATAIALDRFGAAWVAGTAYSQDFPITANALQKTRVGYPDIFVTRFTGLPAARARLAVVSAATFIAGAYAPDSIATGYASGLAASTAVASTVPLPTELAGSRVVFTDSVGTERLAPLFFVSPSQINFLVPAGTPAGTIWIAVRRGGQEVALAPVAIEPVSPGLFTANANGRGVPAALALHVAQDGSQRIEPVFRCGESPGTCVPAPLDPGGEGEQLYLLLFGTGIRGHSGLANVRVTIGGVQAAVLSAGDQGQFAGLDQVNVQVPRSLVARGEVNLLLTVDGRQANTVAVSVGGKLSP